jgi:hypothetical protein
MSRHPPTLLLGQPTVVSRGPEGLTRWGPWQFPAIERLADGRLHVSYHVQADSAKAYGLTKGHAVSADGGQTWQDVADAPASGGMLLANGDRLRAVALRSRPVADLSLPAPFARVQGSYGTTYHIFRLEDLPEELRDGWHFSRLAAGQTEWQEERAVVAMPGEVRYVAVEPAPGGASASDRPGITGGVFTFPWARRLRLAPDGSLWIMNYGFRAPGGRLLDRWSCALLRSTDNGHTWSLQSEITYHGDSTTDPGWDRWDGFTEPNVAFLPDGSLLCFLRTTDGHGTGPMYWCHSHDNGKTWDAPRVFDDRGVWPAVLALKNGATLVSYGRPGLFVRATLDPAAETWSDRVAIKEPSPYQASTCSYSDMIAVDEQTALIAYSDFQYPDQQALPRKTILVRTVSVVPD